MSIQTVAAATTITLHGSGFYRITGATGIDTIEGLRDGDLVILYPVDAFVLDAGGNIDAIASPATVGRPIILAMIDGIAYQVGLAV